MVSLCSFISFYAKSSSGEAVYWNAELKGICLNYTVIDKKENKKRFGMDRQDAQDDREN